MKIKRTRGKESPKVRITQKIGKERGDSYQKIKSFPDERHMQSHGSLIKTFQLNFLVFVYAFRLEISSFVGKSFLFFCGMKIKNVMHTYLFFLIFLKLHSYFTYISRKMKIC